MMYLTGTVICLNYYYYYYRVGKVLLVIVYMNVLSYHNYITCCDLAKVHGLSILTVTGWLVVLHLLCPPVVLSLDLPMMDYATLSAFHEDSLNCPVVVL